MKKIFSFILLICGGTFLFAEEDQTEKLARQLSNPVAALITVPFQYSYSSGIKAGNYSTGEKGTLNIQPVIPISISEKWNLISRTIVPVVQVNNFYPTMEKTTYSGDVSEYLLFSPKEPTSNGLIYGLGPLFTFPTASEKKYGSEKYTVGPSAVLLKQKNGWTYGALISQSWSFAGNSDRENISLGYAQPFLSKAIAKGSTVGINFEATRDWKTKTTQAPTYLTATQILKLGSQLFSIQLGVGYHTYKTQEYSNDPIYRFQFALLFPK